jgi:multidrug efflux pump subunit AcrA (membrane-fusion protein)
MPVAITWDALPGRVWKGEVESMPTQIVALGTRQVGEVIVTIENQGLELLPGTNVNAEIQSQVVENALTVPKEAIRRDGVFVLRDGRVRWTPVRLGPSSLTRTAVLSGVSEGDMVALNTEAPLEDGERVIVAPQ